VKPVELIYNHINEIPDGYDVDFSGGESSMHPNIIELVSYAFNKGHNVSMLSNGSFSKELLHKLFAAGLSEILFSLHGWDSISHDKKVGRQGSFDKIISNINNAFGLGITVRINCVVEEDFLPYSFSEMIEVVLDKNPTQINLLPLNYWRDADNLKPIDYEKVGNKIKQFIDITKDDVDEINVRYIPICFMIGYESYVVGVYQHIFDRTDWNIELYDNYGKRPTKESMFEVARKNRAHTYTKPLECGLCKYKLICDGIETQNYNNNKLNVIEGDTIEDVLGG
jgi:MoaA/NifB/PqqE/SkfB family radical SAM enzyme